MSERAYEVSTVDRLVAVLNGGDDGAEATRQYREIMDRLANNIQEHGGTHKAKLTLTLQDPTRDSLFPGADLGRASRTSGGAA